MLMARAMVFVSVFCRCEHCSADADLCLSKPNFCPTQLEALV
ncbi:hypothetical protein D082_04530 [Synechocystis sp. PCC 6714]|nr:hypothetical protein D082_04530 [Synechocystis sp. PCC 6714]